MRNRLVVIGLAALAALAVVGGCGGSNGSTGNADSGLRDATSSSSGSGSGSSSGSSASSGSSSGSDGGSPTRPDGCAPRTCAAFPVGTCGYQADGCGGMTALCGFTDAALCPPGEFCGGGGPNTCGSGSSSGGGTQCALDPCVPATCQTEDVACGFAGDGCGGLLQCGTCPSSGTCTSRGQCLWPADAGPCMAATCASLGFGCGTSTDGCSGWLDCGTCPVGQFCGGGGARQCGGTCSISDAGCSVECSSPDAGCTAPTFCGRLACGAVPNGCGGLMNCSPCGDAGAGDGSTD